jgi:hypothetical protein
LFGRILRSLVNSTCFGVFMNKSASLITAAVLAFGLTAGAMAADMPKSAAPTAADQPAPSTDAPKTKAKHKKHKKSASTPATTSK